MKDEESQRLIADAEHYIRGPRTRHIHLLDGRIQPDPHTGDTPTIAQVLASLTDTQLAAAGLHRGPSGPAALRAAAQACDAQAITYQVRTWWPAAATWLYARADALDLENNVIAPMRDATNRARARRTEADDAH